MKRKAKVILPNPTKRCKRTKRMYSKNGQECMYCKKKVKLLLELRLLFPNEVKQQLENEYGCEDCIEKFSEKYLNQCGNCGDKTRCSFFSERHFIKHPSFEERYCLRKNILHANTLCKKCDNFFHGCRICKKDEDHPFCDDCLISLECLLIYDEKIADMLKKGILKIVKLSDKEKEKYL